MRCTLKPMKGALVRCLAALWLPFFAYAAEKTNTVTGASTASGFSLNGDLKPVLTLVRGHSYQFTGSANTSLHPFKLSTSSSGGFGTDIYTNSVSGAQPVCNSGCSGVSFVFTPGDATPDVVYYQCNVHQNMGNQIRIVNPPQISSLMLTGGLIGITFTNAYASTVTVQRATNLFSNDWVSIQAVTSAPGSVSINVTNEFPVQLIRATTPLP